MFENTNPVVLLLLVILVVILVGMIVAKNKKKSGAVEYVGSHEYEGRYDEELDSEFD